MSDARKVFAFTFVLFVSITLVIPSLPPAQSLYQYVGIPQTTLSILGIPITTILNGITNGLFWVLVEAIAYGAVRYNRERKPLPPMPAAPHLATPPPENPLVDPRVNVMPPALTIPPGTSSFTAMEEPFQALTRTESHLTGFSRDPNGAEIDIEIIEGIGLVFGGLLRNLGIHTVSDLLRMGATERGRHRIANEVGVTAATVFRWICRVDLLRVKGIGRKYSTLLESAGVSTVTDLSTKNPHNLSQTLKTVNMERNLVLRNPPSKTVKVWVHNAKNLAPISVE
jgi:predicted flap endonuclease-1-like 5' DNA nuclease